MTEPLTVDRIIAERTAGWGLWADEHVGVLIDEIERLRAALRKAEEIFALVENYLKARP